MPSKSVTKSFKSIGAHARARSRKKKLPKLWQHQGVTIKLLQKQNRVLDASDPGTGKTLSALYAYNARRQKGGKCALILAPKTLLESAWGEEIRLHLPWLRYSIAWAKNREEAFEEDVDIYITNVDAAKWLAKQKPAFFNKFDTLIIDEISAYKHRTSQRSRAMGKIKDYFKYREGLTGTPTSNSVTDIWHQIYILDDGQRLGRNFFAFRNVVCEPDASNPFLKFTKWRDRPGAEKAVDNLLKDITVRHDFDECMDIPPNFVHTVPFRLNAKTWNHYNTMEKDALLELKEGIVSAIHAASLRTKLLQIASGAVYSDGGHLVLDTERNELILDLVEERRHSIVFFNWTHQKEGLVKEAEKRGISYEVIDGTVTSNTKRAAIVKDYQAGRYQTLFLHPRTGAHGLTLTKGTATIWASPIYEPDIMKQGLHRIHRGGQTQRTETILVCAMGTVEETVYSILRSKQQRMVSLLDLLQR